VDGEFGINSTDEKVFIRINGTIKEIATGTSYNIGNSNLTISDSGDRALTLGGSLTSDSFTIMNAAETKSLLRVSGVGEIQGGDNTGVMASSFGKLVLLGSGNINAGYNTFSEVSSVGHANTYSSYGYFNSIGSGNSLSGQAGGSLFCLGSNNTVYGGSTGNLVAGRLNVVAGDMNTVIGFNNTTHYEKNNCVVIGSNLKIETAGDKKMTKLGWGSTATSLSQIDRSFELYMNGQSNSDFFVGGKTNVVLRNNTKVLEGTHYEIAATNCITTHNGTAPLVAIANAVVSYSDSGEPNFLLASGEVVKLKRQNLPVSPTRSEIATFLENLGLATLI
jgi:hypothetical protein